MTRELLSLRRWSSASFHALMALELAAKAMRATEVQEDDLDLTFDALGSLTFDELSGKQVKGHVEKLEHILDVPWLSGAARDEAIACVQRFQEALDITRPYEACRYPDKWPDRRTVPSQAIGEVHARDLASGTRAYLAACRARLGSR